MLLFIFSVILLLFPNLSLQKCHTTYVTQCDSLEDLKDVNVRWKDTIFGTINETNNPTSKFFYQDIIRFGDLKSVTILGQLNEIVPSNSLLLRCNVDTKLKVLSFYGNILKTIKVHSFPVVKLEKFSLGNNQIEVIEKNAFDHGPDAVEFDVSNNLLESVEDLMFNNRRMVSMRVLDLSNNRISHIQSGSLPLNLRVLILDYNKMRYFNKDFFQNMTKMTSLTISNNQLYGLPDFDGMASLEILDLSRNKLEEISPLTFANLKTLRVLDLSYNLLRQIGFLNQAGLSNTNFLQLSLAFNKLVQVANLTDILKPQQTLSLSLFGNLWQCVSWEEMSKIIAKTRGLKQDECDAKLFSSGKVPYCLDNLHITIYDLEEFQQKFNEAIAGTKDLIPCKLANTPVWESNFSCVL